LRRGVFPPKVNPEEGECYDECIEILPFTPFTFKNSIYCLSFFSDIRKISMGDRRALRSFQPDSSTNSAYNSRIATSFSTSRGHVKSDGNVMGTSRRSWELRGRSWLEESCCYFMCLISILYSFFRCFFQCSSVSMVIGIHQDQFFSQCSRESLARTGGSLAFNGFRQCCLSPRAVK